MVTAPARLAPPAGRDRPAGVLATPLPWLAALLLAYLLVPLGGYAARLAGTPAGRLTGAGLGAALAVSAETATAAALVIAVLGVPLAYLLARGRGRTSALLGIVVQLPLALPPLMSGILLLYLVGPYAPIGRLFGGQLTDHRAGIVLAQVFVAAPFLVVAARSAFAALDPALEDVAATLGHGRWSRFARVAVPAAAPGIGAGLLLAWLRAFGEFGATVVLAYHPYSLPVFTYVAFGSSGLDATMVPVAAGLGFALVVLGAAHAAPRVRRPGTRRAAPPPPRPPGPTTSPRLAFDLTARLGGFRLDVAHAAEGRRLAVLGASGSGKTHTLRLLAGLAALDGGRVRLDDTDVTGWPAERRGVGYLPQDSALLPHRRVWDQVTFGMGVDPALAAYWLARLRIDELADRRPEQLSGGQQRRVALARALAREPRLLLLDEPFTGLDTPVRDELRRELRRLQRETPVTTVLVTHDPEDAVLLADEVLLLDTGRVVQAGPLADVLARPANRQAARLLGLPNVHVGVVTGHGTVRAGGVELPARGLPPAGTAVLWRVAPAAARLGAGHPALVTDVVARSAYAEVTLALAEAVELTAHVPDPAGCRPGDRVYVDLPPDAVEVWSAGSGGATST